MTCAALSDDYRIFDEEVSIPYQAIDGHIYELKGHICVLDSSRPAPLVLINHGSPSQGEAARARMAPVNCGANTVRWFLERGYAVASLMRLGYGTTGGPWLEGERCSSSNYYRGGTETGREIDAMVVALMHRKDVRKDGAIVVGVSTGGWGAIAFAGLSRSGVSAVINMAGGRGGHLNNIPENNCHPERLVEAAQRFGSKENTPMLWVYAHNDSFFNPALAKDMFEAYAKSGAKAKFVQLPDYGVDGHALFLSRGGYFVWGPVVQRFIEDVK
jgi:dienelactone hydrolase